MIYERGLMNYGNVEIPFTRISEHKFFTPWESHSKTIYFKEYSRNCNEDDIPYYPIHLANDKDLLSKYISLAKNQSNVTFAGRLGSLSLYGYGCYNKRSS